MNDQNFKNYPPTKFDFYLILKIHEFFIKSANFICYRFTLLTKKKCSKLKKNMGAKRPERLSMVNTTNLNFDSFLKLCFIENSLPQILHLNGFSCFKNL